MSLSRVTNPMATSIIRVLGDSGGALTRDVASEIDNLIAWAKDGVRNIKTDTSTVGNVGAGLDVLHTFSLNTPNRLTTNGDYLRVRYSGNFAANDTDKRVNAFFGGTVYEGSSVLDIDGAVGWRIDATITRISSTSVRVDSALTVNTFRADSAGPPNISTDGLSYFNICRNLDITGLPDLGANATTMEVKGEGAANNDVFQNLSIIELRQQ